MSDAASLTRRDFLYTALSDEGTLLCGVASTLQPWIFPPTGPVALAKPCTARTKR